MQLINKKLRISALMVAWAFAGMIYLLYLIFSIRYHQVGIDYLTFMDIGRRWLTGQPIYTVNSYYPMPYVALFSVFTSLPSWLSEILWLSLPVVVAIAVSGPWVLLFAPMFTHFIGGQTALVGLIGVWGYKRYGNRFLGGGLLAVACLKPQLAILPLAWAIVDWYRCWRTERKIPSAVASFVSVSALLWVPAFVAYPNWLSDWLASPRPLAFRAMAGLIPRTLLLFIPQSVAYFAFLIVLAALTFWLIRRKWSFETSLFWYFVISPLVHDYDVITLLPILKTRRQRLAAVLLSIPTWLVVIAAYNNNVAWFAVTLIPAGLLALTVISNPTTN